MTVIHGVELVIIFSEKPYSWFMVLTIFALQLARDHAISVSYEKNITPVEYYWSQPSDEQKISYMKTGDTHWQDYNRNF